ncbi:DivIVA domain-containing protein [Saccharomonospora sp.]|uniref:DivIVA domain-containing protein n=1 Tax=Saccharomonospora sp. TaxID=33913 RepID=UPI00262D9A41|nr:DivIVA domain-containing protein [Saccharomonospora sp.]
MAEAQASPTQVTNPQFATAFRGYEQVQVDEHVKKLTAELASATRHRDEATASVAELTKALSYAQKELADTKTALARMVEDPAGPAAMTERVKTMMQLAEEEIAELKAKAEREAADMRDAADAYAEKTRAKAQAEAEKLAADAAKERDRLDEEARQRRENQREAVEKELAAQRERTENETAELQRVTKKKTDAMIAEAESRFAEARTLRKEAYEFRAAVFDGLTASQSVLQQAIERLGVDPTPAQLEEQDRRSAAQASAGSGSTEGEKQPA